jgi:hypothetical protein
METIILTIIICLDSIICFVLGAVIGQKVVRQEKIEINPVKAVNKAITEHKDKKEKEAEDEYYKAILQNIDNYDGTGVGQVKVPVRK